MPFGMNKFELVLACDRCHLGTAAENVVQHQSDEKHVHKRGSSTQQAMPSQLASKQHGTNTKWQHYIRQVTCTDDTSSVGSLFLTAFLDGGGVGREESMERLSMEAEPVLLVVLAGVLVAWTLL